MTDHHEPDRHLNYLRQALSQVKRPLGFLIGAGCPLAVRVQNGESTLPLIPDIAGLTKAVDVELAKGESKESFARIRAHFATDGKATPTVEDYLSHVRSLRQVAGLEEARGLTASDLDKLDQAMCSLIADIVTRDLPTKTSPYHSLSAWIGSVQRTEPIEVFTTNYDLLLEQALEDHRVPYFDGFVGSRQPFFDPHAMEEDRLPSRWVRLWKLHGSVNWRRDSSGAVWRASSESSGEGRLIHPSHLKYDQSRRMPYLAMIDRMRAFLRRPSSVLVTVGYSFSDDHINEVVIQGLQGNPTSMAFGLVYDKLSGYPKACAISQVRVNLNVLARDEAVVGSRRGPWAVRMSLPDSASTTGVTWKASEDGKTWTPQFGLGDFAVFGRLLSDLIGEVPQAEE